MLVFVRVWEQGKCVGGKCGVRVEIKNKQRKQKYKNKIAGGFLGQIVFFLRKKFLDVLFFCFFTAKTL